MSLLIVFAGFVVVGQALAVGISLVVEQLTSPHASLLAFIPLYFGIFWVAWRAAIRVTEPNPSESKSVPRGREDISSPEPAATQLAAASARQNRAAR